MPTCLPTSQSSRRTAAKYAGTTIQRDRIDRAHHPLKAGQDPLEEAFLGGRLLGAVRISQTDSTGTTVLDIRNAAIMAKPTASVSGMNSERTGSRMRNVGNKHRQDAEHGQKPRGDRRRVAPPHRAGHGLGVAHLNVGVLHRDDRHVDENADRQRQARPTT